MTTTPADLDRPAATAAAAAPATPAARFGDAVLQTMRQHLLASIDAPEVDPTAGRTVAALTPAVRAALLGPLQRELPPEAMRRVLHAVRPQLDAAAWADLGRALHLPVAATTSETRA